MWSNCQTYLAYFAFFRVFRVLFILYVFEIIFILLDFPARVDDGEEIDSWTVIDHRTGNSVPLRADRWYQSAPTSDPITSSGDFTGIRINIWNRAKVRRFMTHSLAGGDNHNLEPGLPCFEVGNDSAWQCWRVGHVCCASCAS